MRQLPLEERSITELRSMAAAMAADFEFSDDKTSLIAIIRGHLDAQVPKPHIPDNLQPSDMRLIMRPPKFVCTQSEVVQYLQPMINRGLVVKFPTEDTWQLSWDKKLDSGTLYAPLRDVVRCAERMMQ